MITLEVPSCRLEETTSRPARRPEPDTGADRAFLHGLLNTAGGLKGLAQVLQESDYPQMCELRESVLYLADQMVEEITSYSLILEAESGELGVSPEALLCRDCLARVRSRFLNHPATANRQIIIAPGLGHVSVVTDRTILGRILADMARNALAASPEGAVVTLDCGTMPDRVWLSVHNPGFIPRDQQDLVFRKDFRAKGKDRGPGAYGMKLLAERCLGGRMSFDTDPLLGTTFILTIPDVLP